MLKRIISAVLLLAALSAGLVTPVSAADTESDYRYLNMVELGIISGDESENYIVTRGEFAAIICGLFGMNEQEAFDYALNFSDLDANDSNYNNIKKVVALNLFSGFPDLTFRSQEPITVEQALKVLAAAAGFTEEAEARGGFPNGYTTVAKNIGLLKKAGISAYNANVKRKELGILLFNLMITPVNEMRTIGGETIYYEQTEEIFAEKYLNLLYITDILEANDYTNLSTSVTEVAQDHVVVSGEILESKQRSDRFFVGRWVSVFYDKDTMKIASITERRSDEEEVVFMSKDVSNLDNRKITSNVSGRSKTYKIPSDAMFVYNDRFVMSYDLAELQNDKDYRITLLDNDGSGEYDIVFVEDYTTIVVSRKNSDKEIFDKLTGSAQAGSVSTPASVSLDDSGEKKVLLYDSSGNIASFDDITENTVVTVIENTNYVRAYLSKIVNTDSVVSVDEENGHTFAECENDTYFVTVQLEAWLAENNVIGKKVELCLDIYGDAAYIVLTGDAEALYGYLVKARIVEDEAIQTMILKIFTADGEMKSFETTEKVKINGYIFRPEDMSDVPADISAAQPVCYTLDEGKVKKLETAKDYLGKNEDGFFKGVSIKGKNIAFTTKVFGGVIEVGKNTVAFIIPENPKDDEAYKVKIGDSYESRIYDIDAYYKSKESETADFLVITSNINTLTYEEPVAVIIKVLDVFYKDEIYKKVTYFSAGAERAAYVREQDLSAAADLGKGDAVRIKVDAANEILNLEHIYDYDLDKFKLSSNPTSSDFNDSLRIGMGYIARVYAGRARVSPTPVYTTDSSTFALEVHKLALYDIIMVDTTNGGVDIYSGKESNIDVGNKVVYVTRSGGGKALVIYK